MSEPTRVLEMVAALNFGGSQAMIINLVKAMDKKKVHCDFIIDHTEPELNGLMETVEKLGCKVYVVPTFKGGNINEVSKAWNELFDNHPEYEILHSHSRSYASLYLPIAKRHGLKTIIHSHNTSNGKGLTSVVKNLLQYPLKKQADYFFGCSKEAGEWLFGKKIVEGNKFYVINNAIDADRYGYEEETRRRYRKEFCLGDEKIFIQVGRLSKQKNHLFTLETFAKYLEKHPSDKLLIVGNGELEETIKKRIVELRIEDSVIHLENRNDVDCLLKMADCFLMPSLFEGLSVAAVEAQASGIRCLFSDKVDRNCVMTDLCEFLPLDEDIWVNKMEEEYIRTDTKKEIADAGFDVNTNARWLEDFYTRIANE